VEEHHEGQVTPGDTADPNTSTDGSMTTPNAPQPGQPASDPMAQMMRMMQMMQMMQMTTGMMGQGSMGMMGARSGMMEPGGLGAMSPVGSSMVMTPGNTVDYTEAWIAFIQTALKITDAQQKQWDDFADALRASNNRFREVQAAPAPAATDLVGQLEQREHWAAARLDSLRAVKTSFATLYAVLTDEQRETAEALAPIFML
jgi:hypothetical protein